MHHATKRSQTLQVTPVIEASLPLSRNAIPSNKSSPLPAPPTIPTLSPIPPFRSIEIDPTNIKEIRIRHFPLPSSRSRAQIHIHRARAVLALAVVVCMSVVA